jgi:dihydrofolate reductase
MGQSMDRPDRIIIVAMTEKQVIGRKGSIPWHIPEELRLFKEFTSGESVIMGRRTFESIGSPLPQRHNIVVSSRMNPRPGIDVCRNLTSAVKLADGYGKKVFFIGGAEIYRAALPLADFLYISWIKGEYQGYTWFPDFPLKDWELVAQKDFDAFRHEIYRCRQAIRKGFLDSSTAAKEG